MTLSELFFGRVEMPARADWQLIESGVALVREAIKREDELRKARWQESECPERRYHTRFSLPPGLAPIGIGGLPLRKCPPNLKADILSFSAQLLTFVKAKCDGRGVVAYKRAGVRRNVYSRIISDDRSHADKRTVLQFCLGLQLNRTEADLLLNSAGYALSETIPEDIAFAYIIDHSIWNLEDVNAILSRCGLGAI